MKIRVQVAQVGSGMVPEDTLEIYCGDGQQIMQWVGYTACARLSYLRGGTMGTYVPQSVMTKDGKPLDIDIVLSEFISDGSELFVEYSKGPIAYKARWEGRPPEAEFVWDDVNGVEVLPPHDAWLRDLDLATEGCDQFIEPALLEANEAAQLADLSKVKELLVRHAGPLQMVMLYYSCEGVTNLEHLSRLDGPQFRSMMMNAKVLTASFSVEDLEDIFLKVAMAEATLARRVEGNTGQSYLTLPDLLVAIVHVAARRFAAESYGRRPDFRLSEKVFALLSECFSMGLYQQLQRKIESLYHASNDKVADYLDRGRRLTEQTLDVCQYKRSRAASVTAEVVTVCKNLQKWKMLGRDFSIQEFAAIVIFSKQRDNHPEQYVLQPMPLSLNYDEFQRMLLGMAYTMYMAHKRADAFEDFVGEVLDYVYTSAGVLVSLNTHSDDNGDGGEGGGFGRKKGFPGGRA